MSIFWRAVAAVIRALMWRPRRILIVGDSVFYMGRNGIWRIGPDCKRVGSGEEVKREPG